ncbi:MAG: hypothetical protein ACOX8H_05205 [Ruminococcus sp.]|jgi:hypothetical protein
MLEVNLRIFFPKKETALFPDYHRHMEMLQNKLKGKVSAYLDGREAMQIYQYYSLSPMGCMETRYLRRMQIGKSVMCIKEGIREYTKKCGESRHIPRIFLRVMYQYLKMYLNSLDYIVVADRQVEEELKEEGVCRPQFWEIPAGTEEQRAEGPFLWLDLYQKMAA